MTRLRLAAAGAAVVVATFWMSAPASAAVAPTVSFSSPAPNSVVYDTDVTIAGAASMPGSLDSIGDIRVSLSSGSGDVPDPCSPCNSDHGASEGFEWPVSLPRNGPYTAHVSATGSQFLLGVLSGDATGSGSLSFQIEVKPSNPAGVRATANADRSITISWARNAEPDMIGYRLQRKDPGVSAFHDVGGAVAQPASGSTVTAVDATVASGAGAFVYQVQAIRAGRTGDASSAVGSGFTTTDVVLPPLPGAPPGAGPGGAAPAPGADGPAQNPAPTPDLSAFLSSGGIPPAASIPSLPAIPDGTYQESLPFGIPPGGTAKNKALALEASSSSDKARTLLIPVAAGLLLCVFAFHVRRFNGWLAADSKRSPAPQNLALATASANGPEGVPADDPPAAAPGGELFGPPPPASTLSVFAPPEEAAVAVPAAAAAAAAMPKRSKGRSGGSWTLVPDAARTPEGATNGVRVLDSMDDDEEAKWAEWARPSATTPSGGDQREPTATGDHDDHDDHDDRAGSTTEEDWEDAVLAVPVDAARS